MAKHPSTKYAERVKAGKVTAGKLVFLACCRHLDDMEHGEARGLCFDPAKADKALSFFDFLCHTKGEWAGDVIRLEPWQEFIVGSSFGWQKNGVRRFRTALVEVARKNGKSTLAAGVGLDLLINDGEPGAEIYSAASKRDQARIIFDEAKNMVRKSPDLSSVVGIHQANMHVSLSASKFEPLSSQDSTMDGLNIHGAMVDEVHALRRRGVWDVIETATGARRQPLIFATTTAGYDRFSVCYELHDYSIKVLEGIIQDDSWFAYIATIDEGDDWTDPKTWAKANPNLGVSVKLDDLQRKCEKAKQVPAAQNAFRRLHCNQWTEQAERWMDIALWDNCDGTVDPAALEGRECFAGLDLASTTDIAAMVLLFPDDDDGSYDVLAYFWVPEDGIRDRATRDLVPYPDWWRDGLITPTDGNVIDYDQIRADINALGDKYNIRELAIDRWNATQLTTQLTGDGFTVVPFGQGFASMSAPTKELLRVVLDDRIRHGGNQVLRWMMSNVAVTQDAAGNLKADKGKSTERIDGIIALIMALGRATVNESASSVYEDRGVLTL